MEKIFTIGYEGAVISDFIATLQNSGVDLLLDIREAPISRKKGFSKNALADALAGEGIAYRHAKALGTPKIIRDQVKLDKDYGAFFENYNRHLDKQLADLQELTASLKGNVALMCFERDPQICHRLAVAKRLWKLSGLSAQHLVVANPLTGELRGL